MAVYEIIIMKINMHEAKSQLSKLGKKAWQGEEIIIAKAGKPYLDLIPHKPKVQERKPGRYAGQVEMSDDFNEESDEILKMFGID